MGTSIYFVIGCPSDGSPERRLKSSRTAAIGFRRRGSWASMLAANRLSR